MIGIDTIFTGGLISSTSSLEMSNYLSKDRTIGEAITLMNSSLIRPLPTHRIESLPYATRKIGQPHSPDAGPERSKVSFFSERYEMGANSSDV